MRTRHFRLLLILFVAFFAANSVAAAARVCMMGGAGQHPPIFEVMQHGQDSTCPQASTTPCFDHCYQEAKRAEQKAPADLSAPAAPPPALFPYATLRPQLPVLSLAETPPIVGPPLTILYGNRRN
jgi:hypothetical protein